MVIWVAIGGRGTLVGSVIGAILVNSLKSMVSESFPAVWSYFIGISFIAVVIFMPYGLAGLLNQIKGKIYAQKAQKSVKRYSSATLNILEESGCDDMSDSILEIRNLTVSFDGFKAVDGLSTSVKKGDIHFLSDLTVPERLLCLMQYAGVSNRRKEKSSLKA